MLKKLLLLFTVLCLSMSLHAKTQVSSGQYYAGGAVGTIIGYGIGHAIQGRYADMGWVFTLTEVGSVGIVAGGFGWMLSNLPTGVAWKDAKATDLHKGGLAMMLTGSLLLAGFRIWEIVDVWVGAEPMESHASRASRFFNKDEGRFAGAKELGVPAFNVPILSYNF